MAEVAEAGPEPLIGFARTVRAAVNDLTRRFREAELETPDLDSRLLVCHACNLSHEAYILHDSRLLLDSEAEAIEAMAARRVAREPVSRIIGRREFYGREFVISPAVLDPRPDTETLVGAALDLLERDGASAPRLLDLGTGSGCILLSLLAERPGATGIGIDIDQQGLRIAQENARRLRLTERSVFACMDWTTALRGEFDLIVSNPPYIASSEIASLAPEVRLFDPRTALDGSEDGYAAYKRLACECFRLLRPGGWMLLEAGANQTAEILGLFDETGWFAEAKEWDFYRDLAGINRVVAIKRQSAP